MQLFCLHIKNTIKEKKMTKQELHKLEILFDQFQLTEAGRLENIE